MLNHHQQNDDTNNITNGIGNDKEHATSPCGRAQHNDIRMGRAYTMPPNKSYE